MRNDAKGSIWESPTEGWGGGRGVRRGRWDAGRSVGRSHRGACLSLEGRASTGCRRPDLRRRGDDHRSGTVPELHRLRDYTGDRPKGAITGRVAPPRAGDPQISAEPETGDLRPPPAPRRRRYRNEIEATPGRDSRAAAGHDPRRRFGAAKHAARPRRDDGRKHCCGRSHGAMRRGRAASVARAIAGRRGVVGPAPRHRCRRIADRVDPHRGTAGRAATQHAPARGERRLRTRPTVGSSRASTTEQSPRSGSSTPQPAVREPTRSPT